MAAVQTCEVGAKLALLMLGLDLCGSKALQNYTQPDKTWWSVTSLVVQQ